MNAIQQAKMIYEVCVLNARAGNTVTYRKVLDYLGYKEGVTGKAIRYGLELTWLACAHYQLPLLTSIVVNKITREPSSSGFPIPDWEIYKQRVFMYNDWPSTQEIDWDYIWDKRKELSRIYIPDGYWS